MAQNRSYSRLYQFNRSSMNTVPEMVNRCIYLSSYVLEEKMFPTVLQCSLIHFHSSLFLLLKKKPAEREKFIFLHQSDAGLINHSRAGLMFRSNCPTYNGLFFLLLFLCCYSVIFCVCLLAYFFLFFFLWGVVLFCFLFVCFRELCCIGFCLFLRKNLNFCD